LRYNPARNSPPARRSNTLQRTVLFLLFIFYSFQTTTILAHGGAKHTSLKRGSSLAEELFSTGPKSRVSPSSVISIDPMQICTGIK
jgi:hypothetical protein